MEGEWGGGVAASEDSFDELLKITINAILIADNWEKKGWSIDIEKFARDQRIFT